MTWRRARVGSCDDKVQVHHISIDMHDLSYVPGDNDTERESKHLQV